jgi:hypothetical protein
MNPKELASIEKNPTRALLVAVEMLNTIWDKHDEHCTPEFRARLLALNKCLDAILP